MYHNLIVPEKCLDLWKQCQSLVPELLKDCTPKATDINVNHDNTIKPSADSLYLITQGDIYETYDGQQIVIHEEGDLLNIDAIASVKKTSYQTDFPATVDEYNSQDLLDKITNDRQRFDVWNRYLTYLSQSYQILMAYFNRQDTDYLPEVRIYQKDDVIIEEGTEGDEVFTLVNGSAKVVSNGEEVGEIKENEIFGAIAALTNTKRTATIIATSQCDTLVANNENFQSIFETRPDIAQKLLTDLARTVVSSNERIVELTKEKEDA